MRRLRGIGGSRMPRLIAALLVYFLDIPVRAEDCVASVYARGESSQPGTKTASGIPLNDNVITAAHKSLSFGSRVKVTNKKNGHAVTVTITDRGPYVKGRCIDLSKAGARALGFAGLAPVSVVVARNANPTGVGRAVKTRRTQLRILDNQPVMPDSARTGGP